MIKSVYNVLSINCFNLVRCYKNLFILLIIASFLLSLSLPYSAVAKEKKEKTCVYCKKYEKLKDWPESDRPKAFIYEEINYPEKMFGKQSGKSSKSRQAEAGKKVYHRFVKSKKTLNKYQHLMIRDMAYFEALFNEMLNDPKASVETLEGLKKVEKQ